MELLHDREFKYYDKNTDSVDMVNYIKTIMARNFIEEIYSLCLKYPQQFNQALTEIEYLYSKKLNAFFMKLDGFFFSSLYLRIKSCSFLKYL